MLLCKRLNPIVSDFQSSEIPYFNFGFSSCTFTFYDSELNVDICEVHENTFKNTKNASFTVLRDV